MGRISEHEGTLDFVHEASGVTIHRGPGGWINDPVQSANQGDASKAVAAFRRFGMDMAAVAISVFLMASRFRRFWQYVLRRDFFSRGPDGTAEGLEGRFCWFCWFCWFVFQGSVFIQPRWSVGWRGIGVGFCWFCWFVWRATTCFSFSRMRGPPWRIQA